MKTFVYLPRKTILWRCPVCGKEKMTVETPPPWIHTCFPFFFRKSGPPVCPKCKKKMIKVEHFY